MSHELRTPLNAILGFTQLIQHDATLADKHKKQIGEIKLAGKHLLSLVNQILDLARIEGRNSELQLEEVNTENTLSECITLLQPLAAEQQVSIQYSFDAIPVASADSIAVKQVILNLLSNAIKYNRPGGSVTITCQSMATDTIRLNITDTGNGIPESSMKEIFEPFNRLDAPSRDIDGTGIGLSITRDLLNEMDGKIGIDSTVGVGSTFWIELPGNLVDRSSIIEDSAADIVVPAISDSHQLREGKILVVEDNNTNQLLLKSQLYTLGYDCDVANNGKIAQELLSDNSYLLILTDCNMPVMNGYQLATAIRQSDGTTPIIGITADAFPESEGRCLSAGMTGRITKPVELRTLQQVLEHNLHAA